MDSSHVIEVNNTHVQEEDVNLAESDQQIEAKLKCELVTLLCSSLSYTLFFSLLALSLEGLCHYSISLIPLTTYFGVKAAILGVLLWKNKSTSKKSDFKDFGESLFMLVYTV